ANNSGGHPQKRKRNRPRGSRECDDCDSYTKKCTQYEKGYLAIKTNFSAITR
ncbi:unnamed protein product, partial [Brassica oleracea var. botrytis]